MAETFQATRDAVHRVVAPIVMKRPPRFRDPWYLVPEGSKRRAGLTPETGLDAAIGRLAQRTGRRLETDPETGRTITVAPRGGMIHASR